MQSHLSDIDVTERAKLWEGLLSTAVLLLMSGCVSADTSPTKTSVPVYDVRTRQLVRLDWDANGDGRLDHRTYFFAGAPLRTEVDSDGDTRVDRWEYVTGDGTVTHVGSSSGTDGREDTWIWPAAADGLVRVARARYRDGAIDRRESLRGDVLVSAEEDANRDGLVDKWETWELGELRRAAFDTSFSRGRPDRRLVYEGGRFAYLETDADGNGEFERFVSNQPGSGEKTRDRH
jgi:hypothetical protein